MAAALVLPWLNRTVDGGGTRFAEIVDLGNKDIIKFGQKVAWSRIAEVGNPSLNATFAN